MQSVWLLRGQGGIKRHKSTKIITKTKIADLTSEIIETEINLIAQSVDRDLDRAAVEETAPLTALSTEKGETERNLPIVRTGVMKVQIMTGATARHEGEGVELHHEGVCHVLDLGRLGSLVVVLPSLRPGSMTNLKTRTLTSMLMPRAGAFPRTIDRPLLRG